MPISYPLSLPTPSDPKNSGGPSSIELNAITTVGRTSSPFTLQSQIQKHSGQMWAANITLPALKREDAEKWMCFILSLNGQEGTFLLGDPWGVAPRGEATGIPLVRGAGQTGQLLTTSGWNASTTGILKAGDWLQIGNRLYKNLTDVDSSASGVADLDIFPRLRESPPDGVPIILNNTVGLFRLAKNSNTLYVPAGFKLYSIAFEGIEAI